MECDFSDALLLDKLELVHVVFSHSIHIIRVRFDGELVRFSYHICSAVFPTEGLLVGAYFNLPPFR